MEIEPDSEFEEYEIGQRVPVSCCMEEERGHIMQPAELQMIEREVNGCHVTLSFSAKSVDGVIEKIQSILSNAYDERVQNDLSELVGLKILNV